MTASVQPRARRPGVLTSLKMGAGLVPKTGSCAQCSVVRGEEVAIGRHLLRMFRRSFPGHAGAASGFSTWRCPGGARVLRRGSGGAEAQRGEGGVVTLAPAERGLKCQVLTRSHCGRGAVTSHAAGGKEGSWGQRGLSLPQAQVGSAGRRARGGSHGRLQLRKGHLHLQLAPGPAAGSAHLQGLIWEGCEWCRAGLGPSRWPWGIAASWGPQSLPLRVPHCTQPSSESGRLRCLLPWAPRGGGRRPARLQLLTGRERGWQRRQ